MIFETQSSVYELNDDRTQIRRLKGQKDPTPRQGADGEWKTIKSVSDLEIGFPVLITWEIVNADGVITWRNTLTSPVTRVFDELN